MKISSNLFVPYYLMGAYAYEILNSSIMEDSEWDALCKSLNEKWDEIQHPHKKFIDRNSLQSATAFYLNFEELPEIVKNAAKLLISKKERTSND